MKHAVIEHGVIEHGVVKRPGRNRSIARLSLPRGSTRVDAC